MDDRALWFGFGVTVGVFASPVIIRAADAVWRWAVVEYLARQM
jgi:hypothetical protein